MNETKNNCSCSSIKEMWNDCHSMVMEGAASCGMLGISTGLQTVDNLIGGFEKGKVYLIGGRPSMGKEEFMLSMISDIVIESKLPVLVFSTNHRKNDYIFRLVSSYFGIPTLNLQNGFMETDEWQQLDNNLAAIENAPLYVHDSLDLPLDELMETAWNCIMNKGIKIFFIDSLQMIDLENGVIITYERTARMMHALKQLAIEAEIPIVLGAELGRGGEYRESRADKRPLLRDLMVCSNVEWLADVIMLVHRPEYYKIYKDENGNDLHGRIEIMVKKNALKPLGNILLYYDQQTGIVSENKITRKPESESAELKEMREDNDAKEQLINTFNLKEV